MGEEVKGLEEGKDRWMGGTEEDWEGRNIGKRR